MFKPAVIFLILFLFQTESLLLVREISIKSDFIRTDHLENLYIIHQSTIKKYDKSGKFLAEYSNLFSGRISQADVSDPMKILLYFEEYNQVIFLDKNMAEIGSPVLLDEAGFNQVILACSSANDGFWIYDQQRQQVFFISSGMEIIHSSDKIGPLLSKQLQPGFMIERNQMVYMNIPGSGIMVFNNFGVIIKRIPLMDMQDFVVENNSLIYYSEGQIMKFDTRVLSLDSVSFALKDHPEHILISQQHAFVQSGNKVQIWKMK